MEEQFPEIVETQPELLAQHYTGAGLRNKRLSTGTRLANARFNARPTRRRSSASRRRWSCLQRCRRPPSAYGESWPCRHALARPCKPSRAMRRPTWRPSTPGRASCARGSRIAHSCCSRRCVASGSFTCSERGTMRRTRSAERNARSGPGGTEPRVPFRSLQGARATPDSILATSSRPQTQLEEALRLYNPEQHRIHALLYGSDPAVSAVVYGAWTLWCLGYPDQSLAKSHEALALARRMAHHYTLAIALCHCALLHQLRREVQPTEELSERTGGAFHRARLCLLAGGGDGDEGLGAGGAGPGRSRHSRVALGDGQHPRHRDRRGAAMVSCPAGRSTR